MWLSFNTMALIAALLLMSIVGGNSKILRGPEDTEVKIGDSAFLNCSMSDPFADLSWLHYPAGKGTDNHRYVYISGTLHPPYDKRFRIEKEASNNSFNFNLVVQNAEPSDAGLYVCQNGGSDSPFPAELIITDSNPVCVTNIDSVGLIGPNSCGVNRDVVQLSCGVGYSGNVPPRVQWTLIRNGGNAVRPLPPWSQTSCSDSGSFVTCNYTAYGDIEMDGAFFACQTNRSRNVQHYCRTDAVKIRYAVGEKMPTERMVGDVVTCSANTSSLACSYRWIWSDAESEKAMSEDEHLTITKPGLHRCRANCRIDQHQCSFDAMTVFALNPPESSSSSTIPVIIAVSVTFCCCCCCVAIVVAAVFCRKRRKSRGIARTKDKNFEQDFPVNIKLEIPSLDKDGSGKPLLDAAPREKENDVLVMNDGSRVDPIPIEEAVKAELWFISNCMLVGHDREFLSILLTFKTEQDLHTSKPGDKLIPIIPEMLKLVKSVGGRNTNEDFEEVAEKKCKPLKKAIKEGVDRVNSNNVCHGHQIKKWAIVSNDFSIQGGELDATMKLNRSRVAEKYQKTIDLIYQNSGCDLILEAPNESNADV